MEQSPCIKDDIHSVGQEVLCFLCIPNVHDRVDKMSALDIILRQLNSTFVVVQITTNYTT
jgi:hypothetical protein